MFFLLFFFFKQACASFFPCVLKFFHEILNWRLLTKASLLTLKKLHNYKLWFELLCFFFFIGFCLCLWVLTVLCFVHEIETRVLPGWSLPVNDSLLIMVVFLIKIKNKIKNINMTSDDNACLGFCLVWIAWWHSLTTWALGWREVRFGRISIKRSNSYSSGMAKRFSSLSLAFHNFSAVLSWAVTVRHFREHRAATRILPAGCSASFADSWSSALHAMMLTALIHPIRALYSLPGQLLPWWHPELWGKKKKKKKCLKCKIQKPPVVMVALAEKYAGSFSSVESPNWNPVCSEPSA